MRSTAAAAHSLSALLEAGHGSRLEHLSLLANLGLGLDWLVLELVELEVLLLDALEQRDLARVVAITTKSS